MIKSLRSVHDHVMIQETHFKSFYNLVEVSVFTIGISKSELQRRTQQ